MLPINTENLVYSPKQNKNLEDERKGRKMGKHFLFYNTNFFKNIGS